MVVPACRIHCKASRSPLCFAFLRFSFFWSSFVSPCFLLSWSSSASFEFSLTFLCVRNALNYLLLKTKLSKLFNFHPKTFERSFGTNDKHHVHGQQTLSCCRHLVGTISSAFMQDFYKTFTRSKQDTYRTISKCGVYFIVLITVYTLCSLLCAILSTLWSIAWSSTMLKGDSRPQGISRRTRYRCGHKTPSAT